MCYFFRFTFKIMINNKIKKNPPTEIKEKIKKSRFDVLTNENDFLVKNLKKAGWSTWAFKYLSNNKLFKLPLKEKNFSNLNYSLKYKFSIKKK